MNIKKQPCEYTPTVHMTKITLYPYYSLDNKYIFNVFGTIGNHRFTLTEHHRLDCCSRLQ